MRWDRLIADLEAQADAVSAQERQAETVERARREFARVVIEERLRASLGQPITVYPEYGDPVRGVLARIGAGWLLLYDGVVEQVIPSARVVSVAGLAGAMQVPMSDAQKRVHRGLDLAYLLRGLATDRSFVRLTLTGDELTGTLDRVAADFVELAVHEPGEQRRARAVREIRAVRTAGIIAIRRMEG